MRTVEVELGERSYPIYIGHGIMSDFGGYYRRHGLGVKVALITSATVAELYLEGVAQSLKESGYDVLQIVIPDGEEYKTLETADDIFEKLISARLDRGSTVVALGGGVVGDVAGFVAATFLRGVAFVQIPTTILAQVDSSVGGKVAVNHRLGKNLIGAFHQPKFVFIDTDVLKTLPRREIKAGLAEVVKHGIIRDEELFSLLERSIEDIIELKTPPDLLDELIERNCQIKAEVVGLDERESGLRAILNYGHTVGHAVEAITDYTKYKHGEAVILGMIAAGQIAVERGILSTSDFKRQNDLLARVGVPEGIGDISTEAILKKMKSDKKVRGGKVRFVLPERIGKVIVTDEVTEDDVRVGIKYMMDWTSCVMRDA